MTFSDKVIVAWLVGLVILNVIPAYLPIARGGIISLYDAAMFAVYLVVLAWGSVTIVEGEPRDGWITVVGVAVLFGWRLYWLFLQYERKLRDDSKDRQSEAARLRGREERLMWERIDALEKKLDG
jgi:hypothetical protein